MARMNAERYARHPAYVALREYLREVWGANAARIDTDEEGWLSEEEVADLARLVRRRGYAGRKRWVACAAREVIQDARATG